MKKEPLTNALLIFFALAAFIIALFLASKNVSPATTTAPSNLPYLFLGSLVAFVAAAAAVCIDIQQETTKRLGGIANTSIFLCPSGWAFTIGWGFVVVAVFQVSLLNPQWANNTFHFNLSKNLVWAGAVVGASAIVIIRSKLLKLNDIEVGGEWIYVFSGAKVTELVNERRWKIKNRWEKRLSNSAKDTGEYPNFFTKLAANATESAKGTSAATQTALNREIASLRAKYPPGKDANGNDNPDDYRVNNSPDARTYLVSVILDHLGHEKLESIANQEKIAITD